MRRLRGRRSRRRREGATVLSADPQGGDCMSTDLMPRKLDSPEPNPLAEEVADFPDNVRDRIYEVSMRAAMCLAGRIDRDMAWALRMHRAQLESPLEAIFLAAWAANRVLALGVVYDCAPQQELCFGDWQMRVDFAFTDPFRPSTKLVVELDGHDFHEKTKEQAALRNQRDRVLQRNGWTVFHFSGAEVYKDIERCVDEVVAFLETRGPR